MTLASRQSNMLSTMGRVLRKLGRDDEAGRYYRRALEVDPGCDTARKGLIELRLLR